MPNDVAPTNKYAPMVEFNWSVTATHLLPIAELVSNDVGTRGDWWHPDPVTGGRVWRYGTSGHVLASGDSVLPGWCSGFSIVASSSYNWGGTWAADGRAPREDYPSLNRSSFIWYTFSGGMTFQFPVTSPGVVGIYLTDNGDLGFDRTVRVRLYRGSNDALLYDDTSVTVTTGRWLRWAVTEHVYAVVSGVADSAVVQAVVFDPYPGNLSARYVRYAAPVTMGGVVFKSEMRLGVEPGEEQGGLDDKPWVVTMPAVPPMDTLTQPYLHSDVFCRVYECDPRDPDGTQRLLWKGKVTKTVKNRAGFKRLVQAEVSGYRSLIQYPIGMQANPTCNWVLGDRNCQVPVLEMQEQVTISSVTGGVKISVVTPPSSTKFWLGGSIELDGYGVTIIAKQGDSGYVWMVSDPVPPSWQGRAGVWTPGCDKTPLVCEHFYSNLERNGAFGVAIPEYNPNIGSNT